ncbi:NUDIX hydrolase [Thioalkalivibrio sp. HK1]|uniref:NUDIX hydrolase n=1 Tax=Thioalkalivibrio sp. HK1 TaxID=1469245 RepID=UPI0004B4672B|nr:CoA pyrophosphatase [Thioalkalivibrio sp. HK1]
MSRIDRIRRSLAKEGDSGIEQKDGLADKRAAVAIILAGDPSSFRLCFVERSHRQGDRWSGDMAFPGGWAKGPEEGLRAAAVRETLEEVGLDLLQADFLGVMAPIPISRFDIDIGSIGACVFHLGDRCLDLRPDGYEIRKAFWIPDAHLNHPDNHIRFYPRHRPPLENHQGSSRSRPAIAFEGRLIWGLTYRLLARFYARIGQDRLAMDPDLGQ